MFNKKVDLQQLDKIMLNESDLKIIGESLAELMSNKSLLNEVKYAPLKVSPKGVYELKFSEDTENEVLQKAIKLVKKDEKINLAEFLTQLYYYEFTENYMKIGEIDREGNIFFVVKYDTKLNYIGTQVYNKQYKKETNEQFILATQTILEQVMNFMKYSQLMTFLNEESVIIKKQTSIKGYQPKKLTKKEMKREERRKRISLSKPKVDYDYSDASREGEETRSYERKVEAWEVVGHWRHYKKSGKRVFVKGYKKGSKNSDERIGKDFTI